MKELKDLKAGDYVIVSTRYGERLEQIDYITPKGFIKVNGCLFNNHNGYERTTNVWSTQTIHVPTQADIDKFIYQSKLKTMRACIQQSINGCNDLAVLERVWNILRGKE